MYYHGCTVYQSWYCTAIIKTIITVVVIVISARIIICITIIFIPLTTIIIIIKHIIIINTATSYLSPFHRHLRHTIIVITVTTYMFFSSRSLKNNWHHFSEILSSRHHSKAIAKFYIFLSRDRNGNSKVTPYHHNGNDYHYYDHQYLCF